MSSFTSPSTLSKMSPSPTQTPTQTPTQRTLPSAPPTSTLKDQDSAKKSLQRENFELKMKVFYLEERAAEQQTPSQPYSTSTTEELEELKSSLLSTKLLLQSSQSDVATRDNLLLKARKAIENLRQDLQTSRASGEKERKETDSLKKEVSSLQNNVSDWEEKWRSVSLTMSTLERDSTSSRDTINRLNIKLKSLDSDIQSLNLNLERSKLEKNVVEQDNERLKLNISEISEEMKGINIAKEEEGRRKGDEIRRLKSSIFEEKEKGKSSKEEFVRDINELKKRIEIKEAEGQEHINDLHLKNKLEEETNQRKETENRVRVLMGEWECLVDLYLGEFVSTSNHGPINSQKTQEQSKDLDVTFDSSPLRSREVSVDWKAYLGEAGGLSRDLGGTVIFDDDDLTVEEERREVKSYVERESSPVKREGRKGDEGRGKEGGGRRREELVEISVCSEQFVERMRGKFRSLLEVKKQLQSIVDLAVEGREREFKAMSKQISQAENNVVLAKKFVVEVQAKVQAETIERMEKDGEFRAGVIALKQQRDEFKTTLSEKSSLSEKLEKELSSTKAELTAVRAQLDDMSSKYRLARQSVDAGKQAVEEAMGRIGKIMQEREALTAENDNLAERLRGADGERARLMDVCERMRSMVEWKGGNGNFGAFVGDVARGEGRGIDLSVYSQQQQQQQQYSQQQQQTVPQHHHAVMVKDSLVQAELEATRALLESGGLSMPEEKKENIPLTPTFLRTTPGGSMTQRGDAATLNYIALPREEQERRNSVRTDIDAKLRELKTAVATVTDVAERSEVLVEKFKVIKGMPFGSLGEGNKHVSSKRVKELESECYSLLDSNARIALQLQQLGLDLSRVYRRFKMLELGEGGAEGSVAGGKKKKRSERRSGDNDRSSAAAQEVLRDAEVREAYENLKKGAEFLEGEEKVKAYAIMRDMEEKEKRKGKERKEGDRDKDRARKKSLTPESADKLGKIGKDLNSLAQRLDNAE
ncbi:hypothetical protein TrVE_jg13197 [Triparma verrucosa]|uniref:Centrosomin N-terminal motif 1 domain-containing protein n=1 Tax=Triparma verrucosa TaxID=1606542 RepID=A0A9W7KWJ5_9STRA|nr:hypothetical protein TrVE_jg13197 [Triparma verrucosa]